MERMRGSRANSTPRARTSGVTNLMGIARLAPGVTIDAAVADAESLIARFEEVGYGPQWFEGSSADRRSSARGKIRCRRIEAAALILLGTVAFVLSLPVAMSRTCCSCAQNRGRGSAPSGWRSAPDEAVSFNTS